MLETHSAGALFHARHAFMPNKLGYCGPDDKGMILQHLQKSSVDDKLLATLRNFEAAYPFIHLIGKSNQREPFDLEVAEAYWIGNRLLKNVATRDFYNFTLDDLKKKNKEQIRRLFLNLGERALPHHTFYVINTATNIISDHHRSSAHEPRKIAEVMDNCRISWGKVLKAEKDHLWVKYRPLEITDNKISLGSEITKKNIEYNSAIPPFQKIVPGSYVSMHWGFACDILSDAQVRNISKYTQDDVKSANIFLLAMNETT
jgi:hypothetical protein